MTMIHDVVKEFFKLGHRHKRRHQYRQVVNKWYKSERGSSLIGSGICETSSSETNLFPCSVIDGIKALEERITKDKVRAFREVAADVTHDQVYRIWLSAKEGIERTRPDLGIRGEFIGYL